MYKKRFNSSCLDKIPEFRAKTMKVEEGYYRNLTRLEWFAAEILEF
jgi:hypothetical protein